MADIATPHADTAPLLELDRASVVRGSRLALREVSLRIDPGQHTAILGANGSGKSTLVKLVTRELYPLARDGAAPVRIFGQSRWDVAALRSRLGIVTGDLGGQLQRMPGLTAEGAVRGGFSSSIAAPEAARIDATMREQARAALHRVGASALAERGLADLSTGELRRVLIARALVRRPEALLLDEPTAGLDLVAQRRFVDMLDALAADGVTLLLVTHHLEEIAPQIRRIVLLHAGQVLADGTPADVLTPAHLSRAYGTGLQIERDDGRYRTRFD